MKQLSILLTLTLFSMQILYADIVGGEISLGIFNHAPSGDTTYQNNFSIDVEENLYWEKETDIMFKVYLEHPMPLLPNIKVGYSALNHDGTGRADNFSWGDMSHLSGDLFSQLEMKMYDATLYYELVDTLVDIDAGITLRYMDGQLTVNIDSPGGLLSTHYEAVEFDTVIPMLYGKFRTVLPTTDISLQLEANYIHYKETTLYDYEISTRYTLVAGLGIEAGYRAVHLDSTDLEEGLSIDVDFKGPYAAVVWDF